MWRGEVILTGSAIRQAQPLRLCMAHAVVGQAFSLDTSRWGPALVSLRQMHEGVGFLRFRVFGGLAVHGA